MSGLRASRCIRCSRVFKVIRVIRVVTSAVRLTSDGCSINKIKTPTPDEASLAWAQAAADVIERRAPSADLAVTRDTANMNRISTTGSKAYTIVSLKNVFCDEGDRQLNSK